jgi:hydroxymethylpyrimidine/phosphomethylpyrimidine kinase
VTPNLPEAEALSGRRIVSKDDVSEAARRIHGMGPAAVIITGGHRPEAGEVADLLFDGERFLAFRTPKIDTPNTHGTGCTFAAAVAAHLALNHDLAISAERSQQYVAGAIRHALDIGHGRKLIDHFWKERI